MEDEDRENRLSTQNKYATIIKRIEMEEKPKNNFGNGSKEKGRNQLTVTGTWNSSFTHDAKDDWHYVLDRLSGKRIAPENLISHAFGMEELEQGFHIMRDKTEEYIKIIGMADMTG